MEGARLSIWHKLLWTVPVNFPNLIFLCIDICDKNVNRAKNANSDNDPYTYSAKWAISNNLKGVLPRIPNGTSQYIPKCWEVPYINTKQTKPPSEEGMPTCPRLPAEQGETGRSEED